MSKAIIYQGLIDRGFKPHEAAGIMGNLGQESSFNPAITNGIGAHGLAQWLGPRKASLYRFAEKFGEDPNSINLQLDFLTHELNTTEKRAKSALFNTNTPEQAAVVFSDKFERAGEHEKNNRRRASIAANVFSQFAGQEALHTSSDDSLHTSSNEEARRPPVQGPAFALFDTDAEAEAFMRANPQFPIELIGVKDAPAQSPTLHTSSDPALHTSSNEANENVGSSSNPKTSAFDAAVHGASQGVSYGFADEMGAAGAALLDTLTGDDSAGKSIWDRYVAYRDSLREDLDTTREEHPVTAYSSEVVGGIASPINRVLPGGAAKTAGAGEKILKAARSGVAAGGVYGAGASNATDLSGQITDVAGGAITGGLAGGALSATGQAVRGVTKKVLGVRPERKYTPEIRAAADSSGVKLAPVDELGITSLDRMNAAGAKELRLNQQRAIHTRLEKIAEEGTPSLELSSGTERKVVQEESRRRLAERLTRNSNDPLYQHYGEQLKNLRKTPPEVSKSLDEVIADAFEDQVLTNKVVSRHNYGLVAKEARKHGPASVGLASTSEAVSRNLEDITSVLSRFPDLRLQGVLKKLEQATALTYPETRKVRTALGEYISRGKKEAGLVGADDVRRLTEVKAALDRDIGVWARSTGNDKLIKLLDRADDFYGDTLGEFASNRYTQGINRGSVGADEVFTKFLRAGSEQRSILLKHLPKRGRAALQQRTIRHLIQESTSQDGHFSAQRFSTALGKVSDKQSGRGGFVQDVFADNPRALRSLQNLADVNNFLKDAITEALHDPKTGNRLLGAFQGAGHIGLAVHSPPAYVALWAAEQVAVRALTRPGSIPRWVHNLSLATTPKAQQAAARAIVQAYLRDLDDQQSTEQ